LLKIVKGLVPQVRAPVLGANLGVTAALVGEIVEIDSMWPIRRSRNKPYEQKRKCSLTQVSVQKTDANLGHPPLDHSFVLLLVITR